MPTVTPPQVTEFHLVDVMRLENNRQGRIASGRNILDPVYTCSIDFDWQSIQHNRVQVEIEVESSAKSLLVSVDEAPAFCVDTSLYGTRVGAFNNGDLTAYYPIEIGVHKFSATAYFGRHCTTGLGPTSTLKLTVRYGDDAAGNGCTQGYMIGFAYHDKAGKEDYMPPGRHICIPDPTIEAMTVACMDPDYSVHSVQRVRFRLKDRTAKKRQPKFGFFKDGTGHVYEMTFDLNTGSKYRLMADLKLKGLRKRSVLNKSFKTNGCDELD